MQRAAAASTQTTDPATTAAAAATATQQPGHAPPQATPAPNHPPLEGTHLLVGDLRPNPWNPNRMSPEIRHKLKEYIRREGLVEPLVVRRLPDHFQILGGFHRWQICKDDLGYAEVPCVVVDVDDKRAKVLTINLNELSGDPIPHLLAELIHDLNRDTTLEDLQTMLPYQLPELRDSLELLKLPDGLAALVAEQAAQEAREAPKVLTFVVQQDAEVVERAIDAAAAGIEGKNRKGRALVVLAQAYLDRAAAPTLATTATAAGTDRR